MENQEVLLIPEAEKLKHESVELPVKKDFKGFCFIPWLEARIALNTYYPNLIVSYKVNQQKINDELAYAFILLYLEDVVTKKVSQTLYFPVLRRGSKKNGEPDFVAVANPDPMHINTAIARGAAKLIAIETGLGRGAYREEMEDLRMSGVFEGIEVAPVQETKRKEPEAVRVPVSVVPSSEPNPIDGKPEKKPFNFNGKQGGLF